MEKQLNFCPNHCHTSYSLLDGLSKPIKLIDRCVELGYNSCTITDHRSISGCINFYKACKKKNIKPILGCEFDVCESFDKNERETDHCVVLAKNLDGWKGLISSVSRSNKNDAFYYKPRITLEYLQKFKENIIGFSGHPGSELFKQIFTSNIYKIKNKEEIYNNIRPNIDIDFKSCVDKYLQTFGEENFFFEIQLFNQDPLQIVLAEVLRSKSKELGVQCVACIDAHYTTKNQADDQRLLLCSATQTTLKKVKQKILEEDYGLEGFFKNDKYYIHSLEEMLEYHKGYENEIECSQNIADSCDEYEILSQPKLPSFGTVNNFEFLKELCREGWKIKINHILTEENKQEYIDRIKEELDVINKANLSGYFLIVQDYIKWYLDQGGIQSPGRGSAAGCLISYLLNITNVDPIKYGLLFSRFFNVGRLGSLPDIDCDFQPEYREKVIEYISSKYGINNVAQMTTFGRLMGRGCLREVLRIHDVCSYAEINKITSDIPDESKIADELEEIEDKSIILWSLINKPEKFLEWCTYKDGQFTGQYAQYFEQAIRMEGVLKSQGKHAAGLIISAENLNEICPMIKDKSGHTICGFEMNDLESIGLVKFDILGISSLSKLKMVNELL